MEDPKNKSHPHQNLKELMAGDTLVALFQSMKQSKTLTIMVLVGIVFFSGFLFFLFGR